MGAVGGWCLPGGWYRLGWVTGCCVGRALLGTLILRPLSGRGFLPVVGRLLGLVSLTPASLMVTHDWSMVSLPRPAVFATESATSSGLSLSACVSHFSPCPLALSDISSASQLSEVSPSAPSVADVVSRYSGTSSPLSCSPLRGLE